MWSFTEKVANPCSRKKWSQFPDNSKGSLNVSEIGQAVFFFSHV